MFRSRWLHPSLWFYFLLLTSENTDRTFSVFQTARGKWRNRSAYAEHWNRCTRDDSMPYKMEELPRTYGRSAESSSIRGKFPSFCFYHLTLFALSSSFYCLPRVQLWWTVDSDRRAVSFQHGLGLNQRARCKDLAAFGDHKSHIAPQEHAGNSATFDQSSGLLKPMHGRHGGVSCRHVGRMRQAVRQLPRQQTMRHADMRY